MDTTYFCRGEGFGKLYDALLDAFGGDQLRFKNLLLTNFDINLDAEFAPPFAQQLQQSILRLCGDGTILTLVRSAHAIKDSRPDLRELVEWIDQHSYTEHHPEAGTHVLTNTPSIQHERTVNGSKNRISASIFDQRISDIRRHVCRITVTAPSGKTMSGTGVLVADDLVLTNYHVVEIMIGEASSVATSGILLDFDFSSYQAQADRFVTHCKVSSDWLVASSKYASKESEIAFNPLPDRLDYALMRLARPVGAEQWQDLGVPSLVLPKRGYATPNVQAAADLSSGNALYIFHHPNREPLFFDNDDVVSFNPARTRVRYTTNTHFGSSGAPCYDDQLRFVALHHAGDNSDNPQWNQGIPIDKIVADLSQQGVTLPPSTSGS